MIAPSRPHSQQRVTIGYDRTAVLAVKLDQDGSGVFFPSASVTKEFAQEFSYHVEASRIAAEIRSGIGCEPTVDMFHEIVMHARCFKDDERLDR